MRYIHTLPTATSFRGKGLFGYTFGPLRESDIEIYYINVEKGHDTFMISKRITRVYYVLSGNGYFTIADQRYDVSSGVLVEVPPKVEYCYSGSMTLLGFSKPRWFNGNDTMTKWNSDVVRWASQPCGRDEDSWIKRLAAFRILGKSPVGAYLRLNDRLWKVLPPSVTEVACFRLYGRFLHFLARMQGRREQAFSTFFLRNRPGLELIRHLIDTKRIGDTVNIAVLGSSTGAEVYSVAWRIRSARPDLGLFLHAVDIAPEAVEFARRGVYRVTTAELAGTPVCERMTAQEMEACFDKNGDTVAVKPWLREGISWHVMDAQEADLLEEMGPQDLVLANNFLCHMNTYNAGMCLRNIARLVASNGYLYVSGIDLDVRAKVTADLGLIPVQELLEEIHEGDLCMRGFWPCHYGGLEPLDRKRKDWKRRYAAVFQQASVAVSEDSSPESRSVKV